MISAACLPSAHSSVPACQPAPACAAAAEDASLPDTEDRGLRNQSDTAESAACAGSRAAAAASAGAGIIGVVAGDDAGTADQPFPVWLLPVWLLPVWLLTAWLLPAWLLTAWLLPAWLLTAWLLTVWLLTAWLLTAWPAGTACVPLPGVRAWPPACRPSRPTDQGDWVIPRSVTLS